MSRTLLVLAVLVACVAGVSAQATIQQQTWDFTNPFRATCGGLSDRNVTYATTGQCIDNGVYGWTAQYCSPDGANIYTVTYDDRNCTTARAYNIEQQPTNTCNFAGANTKLQCVNAAAGPALPSALSFPPANWITTSTCRNTTAVYPTDPIKTCNTPGNGVLCSSSAVITGGCFRFGADNTKDPISYMGFFCQADAKATAQVYYTDSTCTKVASAVVNTASCNGGLFQSTVSTCPAGGASIPSLPNQGYQTFQRKDCVATGYSTPSLTLIAAATCAVTGDQTQAGQAYVPVSAQYACLTSTNGTQQATLSTFADPSAQAKCPASAALSTTTRFVDGCNTATGQIFKCNLNPNTPTNSAVSASTSVIVMIVAAMIALVAGRSL